MSELSGRIEAARREYWSLIRQHAGIDGYRSGIPGNHKHAPTAADVAWRAARAHFLDKLDLDRHAYARARQLKYYDDEVVFTDLRLLIDEAVEQQQQHGE